MANVEAVRDQRWREVIIYGMRPRNAEELGWVVDHLTLLHKSDADRRWVVLQRNLFLCRALAEYKGVPGH
jgi:hypothetical protein